MTEAFALLDDQTPGAASRLYTGLVHTHRCSDPATLDALCAAVQHDLARGLHAVLLADYEWGARLQGLGAAGGALQVLMFRDLAHPDGAGVAAWLAALEGSPQPGPAATEGLVPTISRARHAADIARIHAAIADGETYQVNHTYRWQGRLSGEPVALYRRLREHQGVGYGALIHAPDAAGPGHDWVLSRSLELFVRHDAGQLTAQPMKGTLPREAGPEAGLADLLRALFPCGSITGAPKRRTMDWIAALETTPRGLYCGAIGWLAAGDGACPDLCLNVAIRTLTLGPAGADGTRALTLATGGGIVADSEAASEWAESHWKARFLTTLDPGFKLFETMRAEAGRIALLAAHRARLAASAAALGFAFDTAAFDALLAHLPAGA